MHSVEFRWNLFLNSNLICLHTVGYCIFNLILKMLYVCHVLSNHYIISKHVYWNLNTHWFVFKRYLNSKRWKMSVVTLFVMRGAQLVVDSEFVNSSRLSDCIKFQVTCSTSTCSSLSSSIHGAKCSHPTSKWPVF